MHDCDQDLSISSLYFVLKLVLGGFMCGPRQKQKKLNEKLITKAENILVILEHQRALKSYAFFDFSFPLNINSCL